MAAPVALLPLGSLGLPRGRRRPAGRLAQETGSLHHEHGIRPEARSLGSRTVLARQAVRFGARPSLFRSLGFTRAGDTAASGGSTHRLDLV